MKKIILGMTLLALAVTQVQTSQARGFPVGAAIVGGVVAGSIIGQAIAQPTYYAPAPVVYQPAPVVYAPAYAPVVYAQPGYPCAPVVTYGFGFGRPVYGYGYGRGYYGHGYYDRGGYGHFHR